MLAYLQKLDKVYRLAARPFQMPRTLRLSHPLSNLPASTMLKRVAEWFVKFNVKC